MQIFCYFHGKFGPKSYISITFEKIHYFKNYGVKWSIIGHILLMQNRIILGVTKMKQSHFEISKKY